MFQVERVAGDRLDVRVRGKLEAEDAARMIEELLAKSGGIENGRMLVDVEDFDIPSLGAFKVELARLPELFHFARQFRHAAVLADEDWVRGLSTIESKLIPGLVIKTFRKDQRYHAETWLVRKHADPLYEHRE